MCSKRCLLILPVLGLLVILPVVKSEKTVEYNSTSECHHPFEKVNNGCFYFSEIQMDFDQAVAYCEILSIGHAYEITLVMMGYGRDDDQALLDAVTTMNKTFWVGGKKEEVLGLWNWLDGRIISRHAQFWDPREPNEDDNKCMATQSVTYLQNYSRSYVYDHDCSDTQYVLCQVGSIKCPANFRKFGQYCYLQSWTVGYPGLPWQSARDYCRTQKVPKGYHADLAVLSLPDQDDYQVMNDLMESHRGSMSWIGANRHAECYYKWIDKRNLTLDSIYWYPADPGCGDYNSVAIYYPSSYNSPTLRDYNSDNSFSFICQMFKDA